MRIIKSVAAMQSLARRWQRTGAKVGLVPTMGSLHPGHLSLVRRARRLAGGRGIVVVSIYVNPAQFGPKEDFASYPRDLAGDTRLCRGASVDVVFAPADEEMYRRVDGNGASTFVTEECLSRTLEGASRPGHFRGVATVVAKLFNIVRPSFAVFGAKDYQQAMIVRRMSRDLNLAVPIVVAPTVREPDGLALSSRNKYLTPDLRARATVISRCLREAKTRARDSVAPISAAELKARIRRRVEVEAGLRLDYVEFFDSESLAPITKVTRGTHAAMAVFAGKTRLIDNMRL